MSCVTIDQSSLPTAFQAEQALLGALLHNGAPALTAAGAITRDQFADPLHGAIYQAIIARIEAGQPVDAVALAHESEDLGALDDVGGAPYFQQLLAAGEGPLAVGDAADLMRAARVQREVAA